MIVIESGGTKSTWIFNTPIKQSKTVTTVGLHPQELSLEKKQSIQKLIDAENLFGRSVYFYGAGCESKEARLKLTQFLDSIGLKVLQVQTDIYAACIAHLGWQEGVVGILGTGAVAAQFDGREIVRQTSGLGYLLGDEGSGFDIGKRLLQSYFNEKLPIEINDAIVSYFNHQSILHSIHEPDGRMRIAGLTRIVDQFRSEEIVQKILRSAFDDFCATALAPLSIEHPVHFVGSISFYFKDHLEKSLLSAGLEMGNVKKEAVMGVFEFLSALNKS